MRDDSIYRLRTLFLQRVRRECQRFAGIDHVVNKNRNLIPHVTDEKVHPFWCACVLAVTLTVNERKLYAEFICYRSDSLRAWFRRECCVGNVIGDSPLGTACIGTDDDSFSPSLDFLDK